MAIKRRSLRSVVLTIYNFLCNENIQNCNKLFLLYKCSLGSADMGANKTIKFKIHKWWGANYKQTRRHEDGG